MTALLAQVRRVAGNLATLALLLTDPRPVQLRNTRRHEGKEVQSCNETDVAFTYYTASTSTNTCIVSDIDVVESQRDSACAMTVKSSDHRLQKTEHQILSIRSELEQQSTNQNLDRSTRIETFETPHLPCLALPVRPAL